MRNPGWVNLGLCLGGVGLLLLATARAVGEERLKSPDGTVEVTVRQDGIVLGMVKKSGKTWEFPRAPYRDMSVKDINHKTIFAPLESRVHTRFGPMLYIAYGDELYCLNATTGDPHWKIKLMGEGKGAFSFEGDCIVLEFESITARFDMLTGKQLR